VARPRLGTHAYSLYIQDNWKVTRKLTFDYGLRWDYAILWKEQYGRMQSAASTNRMSRLAGGMARCNTRPPANVTSSAYPYAIGPHLGGLPDHPRPCSAGRPSPTVHFGSGRLNSSAGDFYNVHLPPTSFGGP
jgi:hypothetical protein